MDMRFIFADCQDYIDPGFDFESDEYSPDRRVQHDDVYPHEYFGAAPYDGMLVSRAIVGDERWRGKYTTAQSIRFRRDGVRAFLRYNPTSPDAMIMGDCGAFSYVKEEEPPYTIPEMVEYYAECGFTHGVSIDHVILGFTDQMPLSGVPQDWQFRYDLTLRLAEEFREYCREHGAPFVPVGVAQGWSPASYREAVRRLVEMGYEYVAIGGMVPLKAGQIHRVLQAVREASPSVRLHLFGFTKADNIREFVPYRIESFDSTSPLLRAFKDGRRNYLAPNRWYTAIRVPDADESHYFRSHILAGLKEQRHLRALEQDALSALRSYAGGTETVEGALRAVAAYGSEFPSRVAEEEYRKTLTDKPWTKCCCRACRESGVEVLIFRGSNRNRRRGFHNLWQFYRHLCALRSGGRAGSARGTE
jgi:hypothetical protein